MGKSEADEKCECICLNVFLLNVQATNTPMHASETLPEPIVKDVVQVSVQRKAKLRKKKK